MKNLKKLLAGALAVTSMITVASCNGGDRSSGDNSDGARTTTTADPAATTTEATTVAITTTHDTNKAVQEAVANLEVETSFNPTKKLKWLGNWAIDNTSAEIELFKTLYGVPEENSGDYADNEKGLVVVSDVCDWADRYNALGKAVAGGTPPDLFPFENDYFPLTAYKNMFQPIDGVIDTSGSEFDGWRELSDYMTWNGKHYVIPVEFYPQWVLFYRRSIIEENGFADPYELFMNGEWTWDTFLEMADTFQKTGESKHIIDGWYTPQAIFSTTGVPFVSIDKDTGKVNSNLYDPNVERAAAMVESLGREGYVRSQWFDGQVSEKAWCTGDTLFWIDGFWFYQGNGHVYAGPDGYNWGYDDVFFVPAPKDPLADASYMAYKVYGYAFCAGSTNKDGYQAMVQCQMLTLADENVQAASRQALMENEMWTDTQMDFREKLYSPTETPLSPVYEFATGIDQANSQQSDAPIDNIRKLCMNPDYTYVGQRAEYGPLIESPVKELNAALGFTD